MQFPIIIGLRRSRLVDAALALATGIGLSAIVLVPWALPVYASLGSATIVIALFVARAFTPRIQTLRIDNDGRIGCQTPGQSEFIPVHLLPGATAHPWLTVLRLADEQSTYRVIIAPDSIAPEEFRRLRVWLRWRLEVSADPGGS